MLSASFLAASVMVVFAGMASDRYGRKRVFTLLLLASALMVAAQGFAKGLTDLTVYRVLGFAIGAGLYPIANTIVIEAAAKRFRGLIAGLLQMGYPLGFAFAALVATPLLRDHGWRAIFMFGFAIALIAPLLGRLLPESTRFEAVRAAKQVRHASLMDGLRVLFSPAYRQRSIVCFAGSFLISLAIGGTTYFLPVYLVEAHGVDAGEAARIAGSSFAIGAIGYLLASVTGEFITTRRNTLVIWALLGAVFFGLTLWLPGVPLILGLGLSIVFFYGPTELAEKNVAPGTRVPLANTRVGVPVMRILRANSTLRVRAVLSQPAAAAGAGMSESIRSLQARSLSLAHQTLRDCSIDSGPRMGMRKTCTVTSLTFCRSRSKRLQ
jgi:MFS family permease